MLTVNLRFYFVFLEFLREVNSLTDATQNKTLWALTDHLGSVRDLVAFENNVTVVQNHIKYDAFGNIKSESNANIEHIFGFTARERDNESDLNYYRNRYYSPSTGRFLTADPIRDDFENTYRYAANNPVSNVDPSGLELFAYSMKSAKVAKGWIQKEHGLKDSEVKIIKIKGWKSLYMIATTAKHRDLKPTRWTMSKTDKRFYRALNNPHYHKYIHYDNTTWYDGYYDVSNFDFQKVLIKNVDSQGVAHLDTQAILQILDFSEELGYSRVSTANAYEAFLESREDKRIRMIRADAYWRLGSAVTKSVGGTIVVIGGASHGNPIMVGGGLIAMMDGMSRVGPAIYQLQTLEIQPNVLESAILEIQVTKDKKLKDTAYKPIAKQIDRGLDVSTDLILLRYSFGSYSKLPTTPPHQFGGNANQVYHTFRHIDKAGLSRAKVSEAITRDLASLANSLPDGLTARKVVVDGVELTYHAYKLPNGMINIGRITTQR